MSLKRQSLWSMLPLLVVSVVGLVSAPLFFKYLGPEYFALWSFVAVFSGMFGFADLGLGVAVGRYIGMALGRGDPGAVREYWATGNLIALPLLGVMSGVFMLLGVFLGPKWFSVAPENVRLLQSCFIAGGAALFFNYYGNFWNVLSQAYLDFRFLAILRTAAALGQVLPALVIARWSRNPFYVTLWTAVVGAIQLVVFAYHSRRRYQLGLALASARMARAREMAAYTGKAFVNLTVGAFFVSIDKMILGRLVPVAQVADFAHYEIAGRIGSRLHSLGGAVMGPVFHNTSRASGGGQAATPGLIYTESFQLVFGWFVLAAVWFGVWHPVLLRVWLGAELAQQVAPVFVPVTIAFCINGIANISGSQLGAMNRIGAALLFNVLAGVLTAVGVVVGWKTGGISGAAYGFLFGRVGFVAQDIFTGRLLGGSGWFGRAALRMVGLQLLVGGAFWLVCFVGSADSLWLLIPAALHGGGVAFWLLRPHFSGRGWFNLRPPV